MAYQSKNPVLNSTIYKGTSLATEANPVAGNFKVIAVDGTLYIKDSTGAETEVGASSGGGKNYIQNPDAAQNATSDVANSAASGSWTIAQTTTGSELPEETKEVAFKISGSGLTAADTVEWAIASTGIDDADGGPATVEVKVKDISGTIDGQYKFQLYSVTDSTYVGESLTVVSDGTYTFGANIIAADDYEFHLIAVGTTQSNIGISGVKLSPQAQLKTAVVSAWQAYTPTFTGWGTTSSVSFQWRQDGENVDIRGEYTSGTVTGVEAQITLPNSYTVDFLAASGTQDVGKLQLGVSSIVQNSVALATDGDTFLNFGVAFQGSSANQLSPATGNTWSSSQRYSLRASVPVAEFANAGVVVPVSDFTRRTKTVQVQLSGGGWADSQTAKGIAYSDSTGDWWLQLSVRGTSSSFADRTFVLSGVTFPAYDQVLALASEDNGTTTLEALAEASGSNIHVKSNSASANWMISGTIRLASQPTDDFVADDASFSSFTAALENAVSVAAYIPQPNGTVRLDTGNGHGSTNTVIRRFTNETVASVGDAFTYADSNTLGMSITVNVDCIASMSYSDTRAASNGNIGISLNSAQLTTAISSITVATRLMSTATRAAVFGTVSVTTKLSAGDVLRAHTNGNVDSTADRCQFIIQEVARL